MGEEQPWGHWGHWFGLERTVGMFFPVLLLFNKTFFFPFFTGLLAHVPSTSGDKAASWLLRAPSEAAPAHASSGKNFQLLPPALGTIFTR